MAHCPTLLLIQIRLKNSKNLKYSKTRALCKAKEEKARNCMVWSWFGPTTCKIDFTLGFCME
jgi:hypothetical protein